MRKNITQVSSKKYRIKNSYNKSAFFYNRRYRKLQYEKYRRVLSSFYLQETLNGKIILDLGCGTGLLYEFLASKKLTPRIVGIDFSSQMLRTCKGLEKVLGDIEYLPFRTNSFDFIFSFTVFQNLVSPRKTLLEVKRVLKPRGIFALTILKKKYEPKLLKELESYTFRVLEKFGCDEDIGIIARLCKVPER
jgi:ubiquinone/menaquinone biosynthesis C-methylase UbiE